MQIPGTNYTYPGAYPQQPQAWPVNYSAPTYPMPNDPAALMPLQQAYREAMQEVMKTPEKRREFLSMVQDMQTGKLTPQLLSSRMSRLLERKKTNPEDKPSPQAVLTAVVGATGAGLLVGQGVKRSFTQLEQSRNSILERAFRGFDRIPGLHSVSQLFEDYMTKASRLPGIHPHPLLSLDGAYYSPAEIRRFAVQRQFGKGGFQQAALDNLRVQLQPYLTTKKVNALINGLQKADRYSALQQVMKPELEHFLPDSLREVLPQLGEYKHLKLWQVDQHSTKNYFLRRLGEAAYEQDVSPKIARQLFNEIKTSKRPFADLLEKQILPKESYRKILQVLFKNKPVTSYQQLRSEMKLKPFWTYLNEATDGLLWRGRTPKSLEALPSSTLHDLEKRIIRLHIAGQFKLIPAWQAFEHKIRGPLLRLKGLETLNFPILDSEYTLMKALRYRGVGPAGRLLAKVYFNLNQMFNAGNFQRWTLQQTSGSVKSFFSAFSGMSSGFGRVTLAAMIFGLAAKAGMNAPKEGRKAKLADQLAFALGGYYGFTLVQSLMPRLPIPRALGLVNKISTTKLPLLSFTVGGVIEYLVLASILGNYVSKLLQWPVHKIFGHPPRENDDDKTPLSPLRPRPSLVTDAKKALPEFPSKSFPVMPSPQASYYPYSQSGYQNYAFPQMSPALNAALPAVTSLQQEANRLPSPLAEQVSTTDKDSAPKAATVLYSTKGLNSINQVSRNRRQERQGNDEQKLLKELRRMQKDLY